MASRTYAPIAIQNRFISNHSEKLWCTGEDSNLRSSGERQVYSLLPLTARPPVHNSLPTSTGNTAIRGDRSKHLYKCKPSAAFGGEVASRANKLPHSFLR